MFNPFAKYPYNDAKIRHKMSLARFQKRQVSNCCNEWNNVGHDTSSGSFRYAELCTHCGLSMGSTPAVPYHWITFRRVLISPWWKIWDRHYVYGVRQDDTITQKALKFHKLPYIILNT